MARIASARRAALLTLLAAGIMPAQTPLQPSSQPTLPATTPTSLPAAVPVPQENRIVPAEVHFTDGKLRVLASGSSLNQILRDIGRLTSITIKGSVNDERVYGAYGPATPAEVLTGLLDGTGTNMLLRESTATKPGELILTQRNGGASPPNPGATSLDNAAQNPPPRQVYQPQPFYTPPPQPASSVDSQQSAPGAASPSSGPQTPQQIYQQLQRMQQAQPHP